MKDSSNKSVNKITGINNYKYHENLQPKPQSDSSLIKKFMKITVYKEDFSLGAKHVFIAPSMFLNSHDHSINHSSTNNTSSIFENSIKEKEISNQCDPELFNYPNSSDFDEDE